MSNINNKIIRVVPLSEKNWTEYKEFIERSDGINDNRFYLRHSSLAQNHDNTPICDACTAPVAQQAIEKITDINGLQIRLINKLIQKENRGMKSFDPIYFHNGALVTLADGSFMDDFVYCGKLLPNGRRASCNHPLWCPRCANRQAYLLQEKYLLKAYRHQLQDLTVTFQTPIPFEGTNHENIRQIYNAFAEATKAMVENGSWNGVFMKHEVAIKQFLPLEIVVHTHILIHGDPITEMQMQQLSEEFARKAREAMLEYCSGLDYMAKPIDGQEGLFYRLNYVNKPVNPWPVYQVAWQNRIATGERQAHELNSEVYGLVQGLEEMLFELRKTHAFGTLHGSNPYFIGLSLEEQEDRADETLQVVRIIRARFKQRQARARAVEAGQDEEDLLGYNPDDEPAHEDEDICED